MTSQSKVSDSISVDSLIRMSRKELDQLFLSGTTPTMEEMNGVVDGSVLAGVALLGNGWVRKFINLGWFIWIGKVFESAGGAEGKGINRFKIGPFRFLRYRCETRINSPLVGRNDVFYLNYDIRGNPWYIRRIRDDVKRVGEGLFLGSANFRTKDKYKFLVYFGLKSAASNTQR